MIQVCKDDWPLFLVIYGFTLCMVDSNIFGCGTALVIFAIYNYNAGAPSHGWLGFSSTVDYLIVCYNSQANNLTT
jgi:hypothetical protein